MPMYDLIEYIDIYFKISGSLYDSIARVMLMNITDSESFKFKSILVNNTNNAGITNVKIVVNVICEADRAATFIITDTKLYSPVVTLSVQGNKKLLGQLKPGFKRTINWNKYQ